MKITHVKIKCIITLLALLCLTLSFASALHADLFLWEISKGQNTSYLLGSIHLMPKSVYPLDEKIENAFQESDVLVVELDATTLEQNVINTFIAQHALYADSTTLESELPVELFTDVAEKFIEMGFTQEQLNRFKPWFVSLNLGMSGLQKLDVDAGLGIDMHFLNKAHEQEMEILELETPTSQMEMLASLPEDIQADHLAYTLEEFNDTDSTFFEMLDAWQIGDTEKTNLLSRVKMFELEDKMPGMAEYYNRMFCEREEKMAEEIDTFMDDEEGNVYFIIVGAFHLVGDDGLLKRLEDNGYKIKQLKETTHEEK